MIADGSHANGHPVLAFARVVVSLLVLSMGSWANAGVVVLSSSEMVKFERMQITPSTSSPPQTSQFDPATGMLITAGYPFPVLGSVLSGPQIYNRPSASPPDFLNNITTANSGGLTPPLSGFGASTVSASASASLGQGVNVNTRFGIAFNNGTFLQSPGFSATAASVTVVSLSASFSTGGSALQAIVGALLNASGVLGSAPGSFVEIGVKGQIDIDGGAAAGGRSNPFTWFGGYGYDSAGRPFSLSSGITISAPNPAGNFSVTASSSFGRQQVNTGFVTSATLTLVSDPGSLIRLGGATGTSPGPPPEIGILVGSAVPEPASIFPMATALMLGLGVAGWTRRKRSNSQRSVHHHPGKVSS